MAGCCVDDGFCRKMCQLGQTDYPGLLQKTSTDFQSTALPLLAHSASAPLSGSEQSRMPLSYERVGPFPPGDVYLLNAAFLI